MTCGPATLPTISISCIIAKSKRRASRNHESVDAAGGNPLKNQVIA
jgi:hypothetical protein